LEVLLEELLNLRREKLLEVPAYSFFFAVAQRPAGGRIDGAKGTAISGHQTYFLWGPRGYTGESVIVMADKPQRLAEIFTTLRKIAHVSRPYSMPNQHFDVYHCTGMTQPLNRLWRQLKNWH